MQPVTSAVASGKPIREPHPAFEAFNFCHPAKARMLRCKVVNFAVQETYGSYLGAYKAPEGQQSPPQGWWCKGDAVKAKRFIGGVVKAIPCPNRLCPYSAEGSGPRGQGTWCHPHVWLIAQLDWPDENKLLPRLVMEWDAQSWNSLANLEGMFNEIVGQLPKGDAANDAQRVVGIAEHLGYAPGAFPVLGLPFTMHLKERVKGKKRFPEVSFSTEGDRMAWVRQAHEFAQHDPMGPQLALAQPQPLGALPPPGHTVQEMDEAAHAALNPGMPRNVRQAQGTVIDPLEDEEERA